MTVNQNIDDIRVFDTEANIIAGSRIRPGMLAFATDTHRMIRKKLSDSSFAYWSDDTKQMLLAGAQTVTGNKTYSGTSAFNNTVSLNELASVNNEAKLTPTNLATIVDGVTNLSPSDTSHIHITKADSTPTNQTVGILAGNNYGQVLLISCSNISAIEIDDTVPSSAEIYFDSGTVNKLQLGIRETALFVWTQGLSSAPDAWHLIATTGQTS